MILEVKNVTEENVTEEKKRIGFTPDLIGKTVIVKRIGERPLTCKIAEVRGDELILTSNEGIENMLVFKSSILSIELPEEEEKTFDMELLGDVDNTLYES